ncbi:alpha/beta hydrolase [Streptomyces sp. NPDC003943]
MTAFVLVSGPFTGGWVWQEVVERLRAAGCEAYGVTLAGMDGGGGREVDLEAHIGDVVRVVDRIGAGEEVVLVGHDYGIHPALGAADRRSGRVARVVYLDAGMPGDGDTALAAVPDAAAVEEAGADGLVPAPRGDGWRRWGSTAGLGEADLERLDRLAVPQPTGTLTQPLRLTGSPFDRPTTGVLCTANGSGIDMVELLVATGPERYRVLADPRVGFFELDTGHWPMLSAPGPLADVLLRAAKDEGRRLSVPERRGEFLLDVEERPRERRGRVDLHLPEADGPRPAVLFVHGGPVPSDQRPTPRDTPTFLGYGRYAAALGVVGATLDHRLHDLTDYPRSAEDVAGAVELLRADPRVDGDRIALWFFSGGGLLSAEWLGRPPSWLRCVALTYPVLAPPPEWRVVDPRFRPAEVVGASSPPVVLTRVGRENPVFAATVEEFVAAAGAAGAELDIVDVPLARHGFETLDHTDDTRAAVERAMRAVVARLDA